MTRKEVHRLSSLYDDLHKGSWVTIIIWSIYDWYRTGMTQKVRQTPTVYWIDAALRISSYPDEVRDSARTKQSRDELLLYTISDTTMKVPVPLYIRSYGYKHFDVIIAILKYAISTIIYHVFIISKFRKTSFTQTNGRKTWEVDYRLSL